MNAPRRNMKRKYVPMVAVPPAMGYVDWDEVNRFCADLWENMGFCKDKVTRWYHFTDRNGNPCFTLKY